jgi:crotonobetainyl-CoA:carnitine CoA-transferase CaiB-like acyl-CoA transferase
VAAGAETPSALAGLHVLDLSDSVGGQYCSGLFSDYGADVVLVEGADGSGVRRWPGWTTTTPACGHSELFGHLNAGKRSLLLDWAPRDGWKVLRRLAAAADVVIAADPDLCRRLRDGNDHLIACCVTDFGAGPYRSWTGSELIFQALSGVMLLNGLPTRRPLYGIGQRAQYSAGITAFDTVLAALLHRDRSGQGQFVETSVLEAVAAMNGVAAAQYFYNETCESRHDGSGLLALLECRDAWIVLYAARPHDWYGCCAVFDLPQYRDDPRFADLSDRRQNWDAAIELLAPRARRRFVGDVIAAGRSHKLPVSQVMTADDLIKDEHLSTREFWGTTTPADGATTLGPAFRMGTTPRHAPGPAPLLGEHTVAVLDDLEHRARTVSGRSAALAETPRERTMLTESNGPLAGVRVLDFTGAWAGPMATRSLAFLGAEVIKVEGPQRMDSWRETVAGVGADRYADLRPGDRPYNRSFRFNSQNHDKLDIVLDLKHPQGLATALDLVRVSDVVIDNFSPGVMESLGLGYERLTQVRPDIVMVEMPAYGSWGPDCSAVAFGPNMEAMTGMATMIGYGDGVPVLTSSAYLDPIGGLHGVAAVLTALAYRNRSGRGQYVELAQRETAMQFVGEVLLEQLHTGERFRPAANDVPYAAPHDAFPARGDDEWIAIAVADDEQWARLCTAIDDPRLAGRAEFATAEGRRTYARALYDRLAAVTVRSDKWVLAKRLQTFGVPAAPVCDGRDLAANDHLWAREFFVELDHPDVGRRWYPGLAFRLEATPGRMLEGAAEFGRDTNRVLTDLLGKTADQIRRLQAAGVISPAPATSVPPRQDGCDEECAAGD